MPKGTSRLSSGASSALAQLAALEAKAPCPPLGDAKDGAASSRGLATLELSGSESSPRASITRLNAGGRSGENDWSEGLL